MSYPSFTMSENLAYPLCLVAVWAMLEAIRGRRARRRCCCCSSRSLRGDGRRVQLIVLVPAALTAVCSRRSSNASGREHPGGDSRAERSSTASLRRRRRRARRRCRRERSRADGVYSAFGRYAQRRQARVPELGQFLECPDRSTSQASTSPSAWCLSWLRSSPRMRSSRFGRRGEYMSLRSRRHIRHELAARRGCVSMRRMFDQPGRTSADPRAIPDLHRAVLRRSRSSRSCDSRASVSGSRLLAPPRDHRAAAAPDSLPHRHQQHRRRSSRSDSAVRADRLNGYAATPHASLSSRYAAAAFAAVRHRPRAHADALSFLVADRLPLIEGLVTDAHRSAALRRGRTYPRIADWVDRAEPAGDVTLLHGPGALPELPDGVSTI